MKAFDQVGSSVVECQWLPGDEVYLKFPTAVAPDLCDTFPWTDIDSFDIFPAGHLCFIVRFEQIKRVFPVKKQLVAARPLGGWGLDPGDLLFDLQQQAGGNDQQKWDKGNNCTPAV